MMIMLIILMVQDEMKLLLIMKIKDINYMINFHDNDYDMLNIIQ